LVGCATTDKVVLDNTKRPATTKVDIFNDGKLPNRRFREIAELSYLGPREDEFTALKRFTNEAKSSGAEGIIFSIQNGGLRGGGLAPISTSFIFKGKLIVYEDGKDKEIEKRLIGHWESTKIPQSSADQKVKKMTLDFMPDGSLHGRTIGEGFQPYETSGRFSVVDNKLKMDDSSSETTVFKLSGDHLEIQIGSEPVIFERLPTKN